MHDIFSPDRIMNFDRGNVHRTYENWPVLARSGFDAEPDLPRVGFKKVYVLGMGGSAAGGDIIASWLSNRPEFEIATFKGYLPITNMSDSLAIAISASGQTEETIEMMKVAVQRGAATISISAGGKLEEVSRKLGVSHVMMPEIVAPRYMLPFIVFCCLSIVDRGLGLDCQYEAGDTFREMETEGREIGVNTPTPNNPSKQLALSILEKIPVVYGSRSTRGAGVRFRNVFSENAKRHAIYGEIPEIFHNEIEAWQDPSLEFAPIFLRHPAETGSVRAKTDAMVGILADLKKNPVEVKGRGKTNLAQLVTMVYRLDMVSYYVAICGGRDPLPTRLIDRLKREV